MSYAGIRVQMKTSCVKIVACVLRKNGVCGGLCVFYVLHCTGLTSPG